MNRDTINELHKMTKMAVSLCLFSAEKVTAIDQATVRALICLTQPMKFEITNVNINQALLKCPKNILCNFKM